MRFVPQQRQDDCGVACVAMLAGVNYETALAAFKFRPRQNRRTTSRQIIDAMYALGFFAVEPTGKGSWYVRDRLVSLKVWSPAANAIIKEVLGNPRRFHWCVYNHITGNVWDPADKRRPPPITWKLGATMTHYIPFSPKGTR